MNRRGKSVELGDAIFGDIESNEYLNKLYRDILCNYARKALPCDGSGMMREINITAALRFADLLSKSTHRQNRDKHKIWAQEIVTLLLALYPDNENVRYYAGSVLASTGNYLGREHIKSDYIEPTLLEKSFADWHQEYLKIPADENKRFFKAQKIAYDHMKDECFSYSAPTSMGKSYIMRMFVKEQILDNVQNNFALIVPSKALINEIKSEFIKDLKELLRTHDYRVVTAAGDIVLEQRHNFIFVMTPERLLYLINSKPNIQIDYLFIDEAHKASVGDSRSPFYYAVVDDLSRRAHKPRFIFASPNIPNPEEYLRLIAGSQNEAEHAMASSFSPVSQFKFLVNLENKTVGIYNDHTHVCEQVCELPGNGLTLNLLLKTFDEAGSRRTIVYFSSKQRAIDAARAFAKHRKTTEDHELLTLASDVRNEVHRDYYLANLLEKGVAYHIGYLPPGIRMRIEKLFKEEKITAMFCTSTLLEGVNLPADNLFITNVKNGRSTMSSVDFRNLIGRVGRIQFNLCGNVFFVSGDPDINIEEETYLKLLKDKVKDQKLSLTKDLKPKHKRHIVDTLVSGNPGIDRYNGKQPEPEYGMMREFGLILLRDIVEERDSLVKTEFARQLHQSKEREIRAMFRGRAELIDGDINTSLDQTSNLRSAIAGAGGLSYPHVDEDGNANYHEVVDFLWLMADIFDWRRYEHGSLGAVNKNGDYSRLRWYAILLCQWIKGNGLNSMVRSAIHYMNKHKDRFWRNHTQEAYEDTVEQRNIVIAGTLETIEKDILFRLSNYFLRFSNEYKKINGANSLGDNDWYEFIEYGTTNALTIFLQRSGFSLESAAYIRRNNKDYVIEDDVTGERKLRLTLLECDNAGVRTEAEDIMYNVPDLFIEASLVN